MKKEEIKRFLTRDRGELSQRAIYTAVALVMNCGGFVYDVLDNLSYSDNREKQVYEVENREIKDD